MRDYVEYLNDIVQYSEKIAQFVTGVTFQDFAANEEKTLAVLHAIQIIGEASNKLPASFTEKHPNVRWADIVGMRNFIVHGYYLVDLEIVWKTIHEDLPPLCESISLILLNIEKTKKNT